MLLLDMEKGAGGEIVQCSTETYFKKDSLAIFSLQVCFLDKFSPRSIILALVVISRRYSQHTVKKVIVFPVPGQDVTN